MHSSRCHQYHWLLCKDIVIQHSFSIVWTSLYIRHVRADIYTILFKWMILTVPFQEAEPAQDYRCEQCDKVYEHKRSLARHKQSQHGGKTYYCSKCKKSFNRKDYKVRHETTCGGREHVCPKCGKRCSAAYGLRRHFQWHEKVPVIGDQKKRKVVSGTGVDSVQQKKRTSDQAQGPSTYRWRKCVEAFENRHDLYLHGMRRHYQVGGGLQRRPWGDNDDPWLNEDGTVDEGLKASTTPILRSF